MAFSHGWLWETSMARSLSDILVASGDEEDNNEEGLMH